MAAITKNSSIEINVVIIGETGTGKSTLINYLTNLFHNGSLTNLKVAIPTSYLKCNMSSIMPEHHENFLDDNTSGKTNQCTKYKFLVKQVCFNFFDTPGYLSDDDNMEKIFECFQKLEYLTALVLVLNGTQARLTINIRTILEHFRDHIPNVFYSNMIVILTNCSAYTFNFDSIQLLNHAKIFHMQNSAFSSHPQTWSEQIREILQRDWNISIQTMNEFIKTLVLLTPVSTKSLAEMNNDRNVIRSILHECRLMIMKLQHIEDELIALEQASNIEEYTDENDIQLKTILVNEITITPYHNTICLQCNTVCHERCLLNETTENGEHVFRHCAIMNNGQCTVCGGKCSYNMHYHDRRLIKCIPRTLKFSISSLSNEDNKFKKDKTSYERKYRTVQTTKCLIEQSLQEQLNKVHDACLRVQDTCQNFNIAEELCTFIHLLKNDMNSLTSSSVMNKAKQVIEKLEMIANGSSTTLSTQRKTLKSKRIPAEISLVEDNSLTHVRNSQQEISDNRTYVEYTTEQLINLIRQSIEKCILIANELNRRCEGTSMGYLSPTQLLTLCEYYSSYRLLQSDELIRLYSQFQSDIHQSTDYDPFEILSVPKAKLLRLIAITFCLQNADK